MRQPRALSAWTAELASALPHLSGPQVEVLAEYSMGMVLAGRCGLSCVAFGLSGWLGETFDAVRERLRDWYRCAADKSGRPGKRREMEVGSCFGPLLAWVLRDWEGSDLAVALDATTLGTRFVVLEVAVVYRGGAVPVAWVVLPAKAKGAWKPHWLRLLRSFEEALRGLPPHQRGLRVIVLADRGLYARWLLRQIVALGWHPMLRINTHNADFKPDGGEGGDGGYLPVASLAAEPGTSYAAAGVMFRNPDKRQRCTLLARRDQGYEDAWYVLTDLPPGEARAAWYAPAGVGGAGVPPRQGRRFQLAGHPHDRPRPRRPAVAGHGGRQRQAAATGRTAGAAATATRAGAGAGTGAASGGNGNGTVAQAARDAAHLEHLLYGDAHGAGGGARRHVDAAGAVRPRTVAPSPARGKTRRGTAAVEKPTPARTFPRSTGRGGKSHMRLP